MANPTWDETTEAIPTWDSTAPDNVTTVAFADKKKHNLFGVNEAAAELANEQWDAAGLPGTMPSTGAPTSIPVEPASIVPPIAQAPREEVKATPPWYQDWGRVTNLIHQALSTPQPTSALQTPGAGDTSLLGTTKEIPITEDKSPVGVARNLGAAGINVGNKLMAGLTSPEAVSALPLFALPGAAEAYAAKTATDVPEQVARIKEAIANKSDVGKLATETFFQDAMAALPFILHGKAPEVSPKAEAIKANLNGDLSSANEATALRTAQQSPESAGPVRGIGSTGPEVAKAEADSSYRPSAPSLSPLQSASQPETLSPVEAIQSNPRPETSATETIRKALQVDQGFARFKEAASQETPLPQSQNTIPEQAAVPHQTNQERFGEPLPPLNKENAYYEKNALGRAHRLAQGYIWDGETWVHPDYPNEGPFSDVVPQPKSEDVRTELSKLKGETPIAESAALEPKIENKVGDFVLYTEPVVAYKNGEPFASTRKVRGQITQIKPNGDLEMRSQWGYATKKPTELITPEAHSVRSETLPAQPEATVNGPQALTQSPNVARPTFVPEENRAAPQPEGIPSQSGQGAGVYLSNLLEPVGKYPLAGKERGKFNPEGISTFKDEYGSVRIVKAVNGQIIGGIQLVTKDGKSAILSNAYTVPEFQRQGVASELLSEARKRFKTVTPAEFRSEAGQGFVDKRFEERAPQIGAQTAQEPSIAPTAQGLPKESLIPEGDLKYAGGPTEPRVTGIAQRIHDARSEQGKIGDIAPGEGASAEEMINRGRDLMSQGTNPEQVAARFKVTKQISSDDLSVLRAEMERRSKITNAAEDTVRANPTDPAAKAAYNSAWKSETDWAQNAVKPAQTEWSKMGMAQQGTTDIETGSFSGLRRAVIEEKGRDITPEEAMKLKGVADHVRQLVEQEVAKKRAYDEVVKGETKGRKPRSAEDLRNHFAERIRKLTPC